jgi:WD40 repeat protein
MSGPPHCVELLITNIRYDYLVYYQIFSPDGAIESKCSFSEDDPFTGRAVAARITPPRTVQSIKRFLCKQEKISAVDDVDLLASALTGESKLSDQDRLQILSQDGPGSVADDPMALVIKNLPATVGGGTYGSIISEPANSPRPLKPFSPAQLQWQGHTSIVYSVVFSPDGTRIASGSYDKTISIWDVTTGRLANSPIVAKSGIYSVAWSPDGRRIVSGCLSSPYIQMWDVRTGASVSLPFKGHSDRVFSVAFSLDGRQIASGSGDKTIRIWDARLGKDLVGPMDGHTCYVQSVAFSPNGSRIASGSADATVRVWNSKTGQLVAGPFQGHSDWIRSVAFSPNGRWVVSASDDKDIRVRDTEEVAGTGSASLTSRCLRGHSDWVTSIAFRPDRPWIVSGSYDGTVRIWNFETGQEVSTLSLTQGQTSDVHKVWTIVISPKGDHIVAGTEGGWIYVWWQRV